MPTLPLFTDGAWVASEGHDHGERVQFTPSVSSSIRVLHYLGSKARLSEVIRSTVGGIVEPGGRVCDLFAGSGTVSLSLSQQWNIVAADIQEYSRVLSNGVLNPPEETVATAADSRQEATQSGLRRDLQAALGELLEYEEACRKDATVGQVTALCDLLQHGSLQASVLGSEPPSSELNRKMRAAWRALRTKGLAGGPASVVTRHFGGVYFSWRQAIDLDALLSCVHGFGDRRRDHFLAATLAAASEVVNTIGKQFAQPIKPRDAGGRPKWHLVRQILRDRSMSVFDSFEAWVRRVAAVPRMPGEHRVIRADYRQVLADDTVECDAVYADPPYTRDHYSRYYHVLETMALRDDPEVSTTRIRSGGSSRPSRGIYRADRYQSPFCIKSQVARAFEDLFEGAAKRGVPLIVSYSPYKEGGRPRLLTVQQLISIGRLYYRSVECESVDGVSHNKFNVVARSAEVNDYAEVLLRCAP